MVVPLDPPYLEFAFYVGIQKAREQGIRAAELLVQNGAAFVGEIDIVEDGTVSRLSSIDFASLKEVGAKTELRRIYLQGVTGITKHTELVEINKGTVLLRTEGEKFSGPNRANRSRLHKLGAKAYVCFKALAGGIDAYYGGLCGEYSLEEPEELRQHPKSLAFRNFFVSRAKLAGAAQTVRINAGVDAYFEEFDHGLYVSMSAEFNPAHCSVDPIEAQYRSVRIAEGLLGYLKPTLH